MSIALFACGDNSTTGHSVVFVGNLYDAVTGEALGRDVCEISIQSRGGEQKGSLDQAGRFKVGPIKATDDYTVRVNCEGRRPFVSNNGAVAASLRPENYPNADSLEDFADLLKTSSSRTLHFEVYVTPADQVAEDVDITIEDPADSGAEINGTITFSPSGLPSFADLDDFFGEVSTTQIWIDDAISRERRVFAVEGGGAVVTGLIPGQRYDVNILGITGFQPVEFSDFSVESGPFDFQLVPNNLPDLEFSAFDPSSEGDEVEGGELVITFNQPIALVSSEAAVASSLAAGSSTDDSFISAADITVSVSGSSLSFLLDTGDLSYEDSTEVEWDWSFGSIQLAPAGNTTQLFELEELTPDTSFVVGIPNEGIGVEL